MASELGLILGVSCARVELASHLSRLGCVVQSVVTRGASLVHGNELLQELDDEYPFLKLRRVSKHTVQAVLDALERVAAPTGEASLPGSTGADWFVGYLLLDALVLIIQHIPGGEDAASHLPAGRVLRAELEPTNPVTERARILFLDEQPLGYVPAYLLGDLDRLESAGSSPVYTVERVNPPPYPLHHRVLVAVRAPWPADFRPFLDPELSPLISAAYAA